MTCVMMITRAGGSPKASAVAKSMAFSVRIGSAGNGRLARLVSTIVRADVIRCPGARIEALAAISPSITAATKALDSMYRQAGTALAAADEGPGRVRRCGSALRLATIAVTQGG